MTTTGHWHPMTEVDFETGADFVRDGRYYVVSMAVFLTAEEGATRVRNSGGVTTMTACHCPHGEQVRQQLEALRQKMATTRPAD